MLENKMIEPFYLFIYLTSQQCSVSEHKGCCAESNAMLQAKCSVTQTLIAMASSSL